jgi:uncharacterized protein (DUF2147 family)
VLSRFSNTFYNKEGKSMDSQVRSAISAIDAAKNAASIPSWAADIVSKWSNVAGEESNELKAAMARASRRN